MSVSTGLQSVDLSSALIHVPSPLCKYTDYWHQLNCGGTFIDAIKSTQYDAFVIIDYSIAILPYVKRKVDLHVQLGAASAAITFAAATTATTYYVITIISVADDVISTNGDTYANLAVSCGVQLS